MLIDEQGKPWERRKAQLMLDKIVEEVEADLCKEDRERGVPANGKVFKRVNAEAKPNALGITPEASNDIVIDPILQLMKHSGADSIYETKKRWREFCSTPRDPDKYHVVDPQHERTQPCIEDRIKAAGLGKLIDKKTKTKSAKE